MSRLRHFDHRQRPPHRCDRGDDGFSLMELSVVLLLLAILLGMTIPIMNTFFRATTRVNNTYSNVDQQLPISTNLQRLIRSAVEPAPTAIDQDAGTATPVPDFVTGAVGPDSVAFYSNIDDPNGPAKVTATYSPAAETFTVTVTPAESGTCPFESGSSTPSPNTCSWPASGARTIITAQHVTNGDPSSGGAPVFGYTVLDDSQSTAVADDSVFDSCSAGTVDDPRANCPPAQIQSVSIDLRFNVQPGNPAADKSVVYLLSPTSSDYNPTVG